MTPDVLVVCEESGAVRRAFRARGYDAWSCDLERAADGSPFHIQGDARDLDLAVPLLIAFPPCTRLTNSGVRWLEERDLWGELDEAAEFFRMFLDAPADRIAIENPIPHRYAVERRVRLERATEPAPTKGSQKRWRASGAGRPGGC